MIPILFEYNATDFSTHGIGDLVDCTACETQLNDEGEYELSFVYPKSGELFSQLTIGRLIYAKANSWQQNQIFRIYGYEKDMGGKVTINCEHISYDLNRIPVKKFKSAASATCNTVLGDLKSKAVAINGLNISKFTFTSNVSGTAQTQEGYYELDTPSNARAAILDGDDSIKGVFGGNLILDNYNLKLLASGTSESGMNRGVLIEYGVDLMDLNQEENISEMYTGVYPYYRYMKNDGDEDETIVYGSIQYASGTYMGTTTTAITDGSTVKTIVINGSSVTAAKGYLVIYNSKEFLFNGTKWTELRRKNRIMPLDVTEYFPNQKEHTAPTAAQINAKGKEWMQKEDGFGEPEVNLTLSYAALNQDVHLHDQITVRFVKMEIDVAAKVTSYKYDVLNERCIEIEVGKTKKTILFSLEDASRLKKGLLPPKRIQDKSITSDKYADGSVQSAAIGTGSVGSSKIANSAVNGWHLVDEAVDSNKIKDSAVTVNKIANGAVESVKIGPGAVTGVKIFDKAVSEGHLDNALQTLLADVVAAQELYADVIHFGGSYGNYIETGSVQTQVFIFGHKSLGLFNPSQATEVLGFG